MPRLDILGPTKHVQVSQGPAVGELGTFHEYLAAAVRSAAAAPEAVHWGSGGEGLSGAAQPPEAPGASHTAGPSQRAPPSADAGATSLSCSPDRVAAADLSEQLQARRVGGAPRCSSRDICRAGASRIWDERIPARYGIAKAQWHGHERFRRGFRQAISNRKFRTCCVGLGLP